MENIFVTGAAGFIGSNLIDRLLECGYNVVGWDNLSTGQQHFLKNATKHPNFKLVIGDNLDLDKLTKAMAGCDMVYHLAANADIRFGLNNRTKDLEQNIIATSNVLEAMRTNNIKRIAFSSTGSVYGEAIKIPTPENSEFPIQTSLYATSKLACEGLISSYCEGCGFQGYVFRFVSILGERYSHGHVFDFYKQLIDHPDYLDVLGDGTQRKSYLYVQDCIDAMMYVINNCQSEKFYIFNLGTPEYINVSQSVDLICSKLNITPQINYSGGKRGWVGDNPFIFLDTTKVNNVGWKPKCTIRDGISKTLEWLQNNPWIYEHRK